MLVQLVIFVFHLKYLNHFKRVDKNESGILFPSNIFNKTIFKIALTNIIKIIYDTYRIKIKSCF